MKCKNFKIRTKNYQKYYYCSLIQKKININNCKNCKEKVYKVAKPIKKRSKSLVLEEKGRNSILYTNLSNCSLCGLLGGKYDKRINQYTRIELNEVYSGSYRRVSIRYGMVAPLCIYCHKLFHSDRLINLELKVKFQKEFIKLYSKELFIKEFGKDYEYLLIKYKDTKKD